MIKYILDMKDYTFCPNVHNVEYVREINKDKLSKSIDKFQEELNWDSMWSVEDAVHRLESGWDFVHLKNCDGWFWLDNNTKECKNLYVEKSERGCGYGIQMIWYICNISKVKHDMIWSQVDEWNKVSQRLFLRCGLLNE